MGETAADTRDEIAGIRDDLGDTVAEMRSRTGELKQTARRAGVIAAGVCAAVVVTVVGVVVVKRQRGGVMTRAARKLPDRTRSTAVPAARGLDRWLQQRQRRLEQQREELVDALSERIAEQQAKAERKANPLWRRTAAKSLETAAAVGTAALVRRAMSTPTYPSPRGDREFQPDHGPERELAGTSGDRQKAERA